ncbi:MAG TPA: hypothetical protein VOA80_25150 [Thermoanaerobaculia bacterium]|nr:hypothetical protein [Thermoanaerobaculia bacterium]
MSRMTLPRFITALTLVLGLGLLSPAWADGKAPRQPAPQASAAAPQPDAVAALRSWFQAVLTKLVPGAGGKPIRVDAGTCEDPNGACK